MSKIYQFDPKKKRAGASKEAAPKPHRGTSRPRNGRKWTDVLQFVIFILVTAYLLQLCS